MCHDASEDDESHHIIINRVLAARGHQVNSNDNFTQQMDSQEGVGHRSSLEQWSDFCLLSQSWDNHAMKQWSDIIISDIRHGYSG